MSNIPNILIVDDDPKMCDSLMALLSDQGYELKTSNSVKQAIACLDNDAFDLVLLDMVMGNESGFAVMDHIISQNLDTLVSIITGHASTETAIEALRKGAYDYLKKPFESEELLTTVKNAINQQIMKRDNNVLKGDLQDSEEKYRSLITNIPDVTWTTDSEGNTIFISPNIEKIYGYTPDEIYKEGARLWLGRIHPDDNETVKEAYKALFEKGTMFDVEYRIKRKDGEWIWAHHRSTTSYERDGVMYADGIFSNITERKRAEENLEKEFSMRTTLLDNIPGCIALILKKGTREIVASNRFARELGAVPGQTCFKTCAMRDDNCPFCLAPTLWTTGQSQKLEVEYRETWYEGIWAPLSEDLYVHYIFDITERKRAEEALRESEQKYKTLTDSSLTGIFIHQDDRYVYVNDRFAEMLGYDPEELLRKKHYEVIHPDHREMIKQRGHKRLKGETVPKRYEIKKLRKDGKTVWHEIMVSDPINYMEKPAIMGHQIDITDRKQAEEALRQSEERFRTVADFTYDWELWRGPDGKYIYVSPSCERITGYQKDEFIKDPGLMEKIVHPDDLEIFLKHHQKALEQKGVLYFDFRIVTRNGEERWISHYCQPVYGDDGFWLGRRSSNRDISIQKKLEEAVLISKKLESLGTLAGGIAHDFNNLLSVILANISLAEDDIKPELGRSEFLKEAEKASIRAKELTSRLITFSRGGKPVKKIVSVVELIKDSVNSTLSGSDTDCKFVIPDDLSSVNIDQGQMGQAFYNVVINALEAMGGKGSIKVYCENVTIRDKDALTLKDGKYVKISIKDLGAGIPEENLPKIFDPYFSTKQMGAEKGMGLGLSICHSIVEKHDGLITVESELGVGTTLFIYLPASEKEIEEPEPVRMVVSERLMTGEGKILVMDDEEMIRNTVSHILSRLGYDGEVSKDGAEAIELYKKAKESGEPFDAVILDLTNQFGMGGKEAIRKLLEIDPDIKAIVSTGHSYDPVVTKFREYGFRGALIKPYSIDELSRALHEIISEEKEAISESPNC